MSLVATVDLGKTSCRVRLVRDGSPMLREATGVSDTAAHEALEAADWRPKTALVALLTGVDVGSAARALDAAGGRARVAVTQLGQRLDGAG